MATRVKKDKPNAMTEEQINRTSEIITSLFKKCDASLNDKYDRKRICKTLIGQLLLNTNSDKEFHSVLKTSICEYITTSSNKNYYYSNVDLDLDPKSKNLFSTAGMYSTKSKAKILWVNGIHAYAHKTSRGKVVITQSGEEQKDSYDKIKKYLQLYSTQIKQSFAPQWS